MALWVGFDLDDTLHDFSGANATAHAAVVTRIAQVSGLAHAAAKEIYDRARLAFQVRHRPQDYYIAGRTRAEWRQHITHEILKAFDLPREPLVAELAALYRESLYGNLTGYPEAPALLHCVRSAGRRIVLITNAGDEHAVDVLARLELTSLFDRVITTTRRAPKEDGLYAHALKEMNIDPSALAYIGDTLDADIVPAIAAGIRPVWLRHAHVPADEHAPAGVPVVSRLADAEPYLLGG